MSVNIIALEYPVSMPVPPTVTHEFSITVAVFTTIHTVQRFLQYIFIHVHHIHVQVENNFELTASDSDPPTSNSICSNDMPTP